MARIIILGGGRQGSIIARDLAGDNEVTVVDPREVGIPGVRSLRMSISDHGIVSTLREHDLVVGALPARLGYAAAQAAIEAKRSFVDVAFYAEDAAQLHEPARRANIAILPDCGLAPGLSNLIVGRAFATRAPKEVHVQVGGVARDPKRPYGYAITWSPEDLLDEYVRPARIIQHGKAVSVPALSGLERIKIDGVGEMEAFFTDGLRTLLSYEGRVVNMTEKTLRWPGHVEAVKPLLASGTLAQELGDECSSGEDLVVFRIQVDKDVVTMVDTARGGLSAMARTTALTTAIFARWVAQGRMMFTGLVPPERLAADHDAYHFILDQLKVRGINFNPPYPFVRPDPYR